MRMRICCFGMGWVEFGLREGGREGECEGAIHG